VRRPHELDVLSFRTVERLCYALECEPGELFGWDDAQPPRPKAHARPVNTPPARDRAQRWQAEWERDHPTPPRPAASPPASPALPDMDDEAEEDDYIRPDELRRLGDAAPTTRVPVLRKPAPSRPAPVERQQWDGQATVPAPEAEAQPMPPRQVGLSELI
jgi:hypothetical protein